MLLHVEHCVCSVGEFRVWQRGLGDWYTLTCNEISCVMRKAIDPPKIKVFVTVRQSEQKF